MADDKDNPRVNPGYALAQLARALSGAGELAARRVAQWRQVIAGLLDGTLRVGSRTPVSDMPPWVTLEVVHGGFATGSYAASGPLLAHEVDILRSLRAPESAAPPTVATDRGLINLHYVGDVGRGELASLLTDGRYRIRVPEEAALLVVAWLIGHGETARGAELVETILPFFDRLRFYPVPHARPLTSGTDVYLQTAGESAAQLRAVRPKTAVIAMKEAVGVWTPLYDRAAALFLETVDGDVPSLRSDASGVLARRQDGNPIVEGGWPCRRYADDWRVRAQRLLDEYAAARVQHRLCRKPERRKENFTRLRGYLARCVEDPAAPTGRDVGMIRKILASYVTRHGLPGSDRFEKLRSARERSASAPLHAGIAQLVARRLEAYPSDEGIRDLDDCLRPVADPDLDGAASGGSAIPPAVAAKATRCLLAPIETLMDRGLVSSSESMARILPTLTGAMRASMIDDPLLRRVYEAVYLAFRRRRSLLLLDLESQVRLDELPWIAAIQPWVGSDAESRKAAHETLRRATTLAVRAFPQTILPNKLIKELRAMAVASGAPLPLTEELAADIFMGAFSETFLRAAQIAARLLHGSIYERYYGVPYDRVLRLDDVRKEQFGAPTSPGFAALCGELASPATGKGSFVARNGTIIEQAQIVTTHNLAALFDRLDLASSMSDELSGLAQKCFRWVCMRLQLKIPVWRAQLQTMKNAAYAWRQMVFFVSLMKGDQLDEFLKWSATHLAAQRDDFRRRFDPVLIGLVSVAQGEAFDGQGQLRSGEGRRFLGWSVGRHWLLPERA